MQRPSCAPRGRRSARHPVLAWLGYGPSSRPLPCSPLLVTSWLVSTTRPPPVRRGTRDVGGAGGRAVCLPARTCQPGAASGIPNAFLRLFVATFWTTSAALQSGSGSGSGSKSVGLRERWSERALSEAIGEGGTMAAFAAPGWSLGAHNWAARSAPPPPRIVGKAESQTIRTSSTPTRWRTTDCTFRVDPCVS